MKALSTLWLLCIFSIKYVYNYIFLWKKLLWAAVKRRGSILAWTVILSVYGADTIAIDLYLPALFS
jgi:hypothetical protein